MSAREEMESWQAERDAELEAWAQANGIDNDGPEYDGPEPLDLTGEPDGGWNTLMRAMGRPSDDPKDREAVAQEHDTGEYIDWSTVWDKPIVHEWVVPGILAKGRGHSIFATHGVGKSLLTLWMCTEALKAGHAVLYLDYEMGEEDVVERLKDMGYGKDDADLFRAFKYAVAPSMSALNSEDGAGELGSKLMRISAEFPDKHVVVVIDTIGRAVDGEENSNDTMRDFYREAGYVLKNRKVTWLRLDHAGKDKSRGARGGSAKGDDVDIAWALSKDDPEALDFDLLAEKARMGWVPRQLKVVMLADPLRFLILGADDPAALPEEIKRFVEALDELKVPDDATVREQLAALKRAGVKGTAKLKQDAIKYRQDRAS